MVRCFLLRSRRGRVIFELSSGSGNQTNCTPGVNCVYRECDYAREPAAHPIVKGLQAMTTPPTPTPAPGIRRYQHRPGGWTVA
jgi:hypothetical protein